MSYELMHNKQPVCPHCKAVYDIDKNETYHLFDPREENHELYCPSCEKYFNVVPHVTFTFSTDLDL